MKYFLDTNVIYHISQNSFNSKVRADLLLKKVKNSICYVSMYSLFEILNNDHINLEEFRRIYLSLTDYIEVIGFFIDNEIAKYTDLEVWKNITETEDIIINNELQKFKYQIINKYAREIAFVNMVVISNYIDPIFYYFKHHNHPRTKSIINYIGNIMEDLKNRMRKFFVKILKNELSEFNEKSIKRIYRKIIIGLVNEFIPTYNYISQSINNEVFPNYNEIKEMIKKWYDLVDLDRYSQDKIVEEYVDIMNIYKMQYKNLDDETRAKIDNIEELFLKYTLSNINLGKQALDFEILFIKKSVRQIFQGNFSIQSNDYLDMYILNQFVRSDADVFITFDENLLKVMSQSTNIKLKKSVTEINSLFRKNQND